MNKSKIFSVMKKLGGCLFATALVFLLGSQPVYAEEIEEENNEIMLMIEYELDKVAYLDGEELYINSSLLEQYGNVLVMNKTSSKLAVYYFESLTYGSTGSFSLSNYAYHTISDSDDIGKFKSVSASSGSLALGGTTVFTGSSIDIYKGDELYFMKNILFNSTYNISFNTGYDDIVIQPLQTDNKGLIDSLPTPLFSPTGLMFDGWYLESDLVTKVDNNYVFNSDTTLYAKWSEEKTLELKDYSEQVESIIFILKYIFGIMLFFLIIILCKYVYSFFNMFF